MKISKFKLLLAGIFSVSSVGIPFSSFAASNKYEASVYVTNISGAEEAAAVLHHLKMTVNRNIIPKTR